MGRTDPNAAPHKQQSMVLVPMDTPGVRIVRPLQVYGIDDAPYGHMELEFKVRLHLWDVSHIAVGCARSSNKCPPRRRSRYYVAFLAWVMDADARVVGFEIAQARLGPGRIHHCMRLIGATEAALDKLCARVKTRRAFGRTLKEFATIQNDIANNRIELEQGRLLVLRTAHAIDVSGAKVQKRRNPI